MRFRADSERYSARTISSLASNLPFLGRLLAIVMSRAAGLWRLSRDRAERGFAISLKLFSFIAESVFTIIPESCSYDRRTIVLDLDVRRQCGAACRRVLTVRHNRAVFN